MTAINNELEQTLTAILTEEQFAQWQSLRAKNQDAFKQRLRNSIG